MKKVLYIAIGFVILGLISRFVSKSNTTTTKPNKAETEAKNIPGANPVDVYLNLEKKGFKVDKQLGSGSCSWLCTKQESGLSYTVNVLSEKPTQIQQVAITAALDGSESDKLIIATKPFIKWVSSFPYEGQDVQKLASWIENNFDRNGASITIGAVQFTMSAPNKSTRQLNAVKV